MTKIQEEKPMFVRVGKLREYTLEICRCKKYVCTISELREYEILEREEKPNTDFGVGHP